MHVDRDAFSCCLPVAADSRLAAVFVADRLSRLDDLSLKNFNLSILCLVYIGVNLVCFILNSMPGPWRHKHALTFHLLEFWATFGFSCVQVYALTFSPRSFVSMYNKPIVLKMVVVFNVVASFVPAVLVSISLSSFEVVAHELEYFNEITMAFVDLVFFASLVRSSACSWTLDGAIGQLVATMLALLIAITQLCVYNLLGGPSGGAGEQIAHYFEFVFEILSAIISFLFCMDNKLMCDDTLRQLLKMQHLPVRAGHWDVEANPDEGRLSAPTLQNQNEAETSSRQQG